jgi:2,6-dihydroxypseudooxynicotine hydrolase
MSATSAAGGDRLTQEAMAHWYGRLLANGVSYFDASDVIPRVTSWREWCRLWIERGALREKEAEAMAGEGRRLSAAEGFVRAALAYHFAQFVYNEDAALKREAQEKKVAAYTRALADLRPPGERVSIPYEAGALPGVLRFPTEGKGRAPLVLLVAGLDSTKEEFHTLEKVLHARGLATLAFDGPAQGERADLPLRPDYEGVISAVVDFISRDARVDPGRIGALGVSLGGYYCPRGLAAEKRLRAGVAAGGFYDMAGFWDTLPALTRQGFQHSLQASSLEEARERARALSLRGRLAGLDRPLLVIGGELDRVCPPEDSRLMAREAGAMADLVVYPEGTHVCNNIPFRWRPLAADWLAEKLA